MKTILLILTFALSGLNGSATQETMKLNGLFDKYENGVYYFSTYEGDTYQFQEITEEASKLYDFSGSENVGLLFAITYNSELKETPNKIEYNTITNIIKLQ
ncbi:hypothetical protein J8L85_07275 [Maribacter sp. MMG018]|uniref:hypothetical protein n=1 Tax=Maribacter sp. MMG018 TaxID=2822688 RepID=UPI001B36C8B5|nr:hypothetical protein [Maribacter sp. MMG018]MBQ4914231.1 hypothetical protein [Maribacter sp. MMG018]